jgi:hypothetical protein
MAVVGLGQSLSGHSVHDATLFAFPRHMRRSAPRLRPAHLRRLNPPAALPHPSRRDTTCSSRWTQCAFVSAGWRVLTFLGRLRRISAWEEGRELGSPPGCSRASPRVRFGERKISKTPHTSFAKTSPKNNVPRRSCCATRAPRPSTEAVYMQPASRHLLADKRMPCGHAVCRFGFDLEEV